MRMRTALIVGAIAWVASFVVPGYLAMGLSAALSPLFQEGWSFLALLAIVMLAGRWLQGMLWGVTVLVPLCALIERLNPGGVRTRKLLTLMLALWAVPAAFIPLLVEGKAREAGLLKPQPSECMGKVSVSKFEPVRTESGGLAIEGTISNTGDLHASLLEIKYDLVDSQELGPLRRVLHDAICTPLRDDGRGTSEETTPIGPHSKRDFRCEVPGIEARDHLPKAEITMIPRWGCVELGKSRFK
ncbi:MAG TPA: hypothetical protein VFT43_13535 [Candidatus Polarisedimenticolia bacterium]|nr:hypothetical protein [Candidatus Polarisedimenticolia bacterium]